MPHREVAMHVHEAYEIDGWWAQTVTVGYERIRGLRQRGQRRDGTFEAHKSKTFAVPIGNLYQAFSTKRVRERWLPGVDVTVRKSTRDKSIRFLWEDGAPVEAYFTAKGSGKSQVQVQHRKLPTKAAATEAKEYWADRFGDLGELLVKARR